MEPTWIQHQRLKNPAATPATAASPPQFTGLKEHLRGLLKDKGAQQEAQESKLRQARAAYLQQAILYEYTHTLCAKVPSQTTTQTEVSLQQLAMRLKVAKAIQRLQVLPGAASQPHRLLGVAPQDLLDKCSSTLGEQQAMVTTAASILSGMLQDQASALAQLLHKTTTALGDSTCALSIGSSPVKASGLTSKDHASNAAAMASTQDMNAAAAARASLPYTVITMQQASLQSCKVSTAAILQQQFLLCQQLLGLLGSCTNSLLSFLFDQLAGRQQEQTQFAANLAGEHTRSLCHKVSHMETTLLNFAYNTKSSVAAAAAVHATLSHKAAEAEEQLLQVQYLVSAYEALGPAFQDIVSVYFTVCKELDNAMHSLNIFNTLQNELDHRTIA